MSIPCCYRCGEEITSKVYYSVWVFNKDDQGITERVADYQHICEDCYLTFKYWVNACHGWDE